MQIYFKSNMCLSIPCFSFLLQYLAWKGQLVSKDRGQHQLETVGRGQLRCCEPLHWHDKNDSIRFVDLHWESTWFWILRLDKLRSQNIMKRWCHEKSLTDHPINDAMTGLLLALKVPCHNHLEHVSSYQWIWLKCILNSLAAIVTAGGFVPWEGVLDQERHSRYTDVVWMHAVVMPWSGGTTKTGSWMRNMVSSVTLLEVDCGNWRFSKFRIWVAPHLTFMFDQDECMLKLGTDFGKKMLPDLQCQMRVESETPFWRVESCLLGMLHVRALGDSVCSSVMWVCFKIRIGAAMTSN